MPMTRELKKRFMGIEDRLEKIEKRKPVQKTNGEEIPENGDLEERVDLIEMVLQIPGERDGDTQVLSAWRQIVEKILHKLEDRLVKVELRGAWTPDEAKTLDVRVKNLWDRPSAESLKLFLTAIEDRVSKLEQVPVAGNLSHITQKMQQEIKEINESVKTLRRKVRLSTWLSLLLFAMILLTLYLV